MTPTTPTQGEKRLVPEDHAAIKRCVERQPKLYVRGQHEGYYVHSDIADLIDIIGRLAAAPSAPVVGREEIARAVHDWILDDVPLGLKLQMDRVLSNKLTDRILSALHASPAIDPRLTEWGYSTTDEAITHLGKLLEDQTAFDGLAEGSRDDPHERWGILNHVGGIWTDENFETERQAQAYLDRYQRENPKMDPSKHKVIPVLVTIRPDKREKGHD